jgi:hypothetical protein
MRVIENGKVVLELENLSPISCDDVARLEIWLFGELWDIFSFCPDNESKAMDEAMQLARRDSRPSDIVRIRCYKLTSGMN